MEAMALLSDDEVTAGLDGLPGWERSGDEIVKTYQLASFPDAIAFVTRVGFFAEQANHHPDLDIRWRNVARRAVDPRRRWVDREGPRARR